MKKSCLIISLSLVCVFCFANVNDDLIKYASRGDAAGVQAALKKGARVGVTDQLGRTALHLAAAKGSLDVMDVLLSHSAPLGAKDSYGMTSLLRAAKSLQGAAVKRLLEWGADRASLVALLSARDSSGQTLLHQAARKGSADAVAAFLEMGIDVDVRDNTGRTPLSLAVVNAGVEAGAGRRGYIEVIRGLLDRGGNPTLPDEKGYSPLWYAVRQDDGELVLLLSTKGVDANAVSEAYDRGDALIAQILTDRITNASVADASGRTFLHVAAQQGIGALAERCLALSAEVDAVDRFGRTPLAIAASRGDERITRILLEAGADPTRPGERGATPLELAARQGSVAVAELLIQWGAEVNSRTKTTPLLEAVQARNLEMAGFLLSRGADVNTSDEKENAPIYYAVETRTGISGLDMVKLLLEQGALVDQRNAGGVTALLRAVEAGKREEAALLLERGADPGAPDDRGRTPLSVARQRGDKAMVALLAAPRW